jgi:hypothetical protein
VGIGTDSPSSVLHIYKDVHPNAGLAKFENPSGEAIVQIKSQNDTLGVIEFADSEDSNVGAIQYSHADNSMRVKTNDAEKMRIDSSGNIGIGLSSPQDLLDVNGTMRAFGYESRSGTNGIQQYTGDYFNIFWTGSAAQLYIDASSVGTITLTSDYRVKKNIETQNAAAIDRINALRPVKFEYADYEDIFVADNVQREGFIAHEVAEIIPSAVEGEKDAENALQSLKLDAMMSVAFK